jgi:hypothetical protein
MESHNPVMFQSTKQFITIWGVIPSAKRLHHELENPAFFRVNPLFLFSWCIFTHPHLTFFPTSTNLPHLPTSDRPGPLGPLGVSWVLGPRPGGRTRASWGTCPAADRCGTARGTSRRARTAGTAGTEDPGPWRPGFCPKKKGVLKIYRDLSGFNGNIMGKHRLYIIYGISIKSYINYH